MMEFYRIPRVRFGQKEYLNIEKYYLFVRTIVAE